MAPVSLKLSLIVPFAVAALAGCSAGDTGASMEATTTSSQQMLDFVNDPDTDAKLLDLGVKLDSRAATNIIAARNGADGVYPSADDAPFTSAAQLDAISYVGSATLTKLAAYAAAHPAPSGESVEGVSFSGWQSVAVVWGMNHSSAASLDGFLDARTAKSLAAGAPFTSVAKMGPLAYVGPSALTALRAHAATWWTASKIQSELGNLLFMSESDRPFDVVSFPGAGTTAPTASSLLVLVSAPAGSTSALRNVSDYFGDFENDATAAAAVQAEFGRLTDVTYVAVFAPPDSIDKSLVDVYLVGRTSAGDLVGIHSISVET